MRDLDGEAELAVLGSVLVSAGACLDDLHLTGADFTDPHRGDLFDLMVTMHADGKPVEAYTLADANPDQAGFLFDLTSGPYVASSAGYYADIVSKRALLRRLAAAGAGLAADPEDMDAAQIADRARGILEKAIGTPAQKVRYVRDILPAVMARDDGQGVFVPSPWHSLNDLIGGFRPGAVYVIAARPGIGKSVVASQIATGLARRGHVAFSSLEMSADELVTRIVAEQVQVNVGRVKDGRMTVLDRQKLGNAKQRLERLTVAIDDRAAISAGDVRAFARAVSHNGPLAGVVVDYMQLMSSRSRVDRHLQVAEFSRQMKIMAKDFRVPVIALSQLNRNSEATLTGVPKLSDLRESGAIEQDADVVILLRRDGEPPSESLVMDVAKNRHGQTGEFSLAWDGGYQRAVEWDSAGDWS